ncbi:MAG: phosphatase PAP2 family protein, partial [Saprospiraceae bacterium]|nr:phosphatase PAP2 family protein [Saprospiraceae bacterium]
PHGHEILYLNPWRTEPWNRLFRWATQLGEPLAFVFFGLLSALWRFRFAALIALAGLILPPLSYVLKDKIGTDRPITHFNHTGLRDAVVTVPEVELNGGQTSFPSGHTTAAFCMYGLMALMSRKRWPALGLFWFGLAFLVAFSRVFLVQHFLIDVLGGAALGLFLSLLVWEINVRYLEKWPVLNRGLLPAARNTA